MIEGILIALLLYFLVLTALAYYAMYKKRRHFILKNKLEQEYQDWASERRLI